MADTIELTDGTNTIDFIAATGLRGQPSWHPAIAIPTGDKTIPPYLTDVIPVVVDNTTTDTMATSLQTFHLLQVEAAEYWSQLEATTPVWLNTTVDNETNDRRSLVRSLQIEFRPGLGNLYDCNVLDGVLALVTILHHPYQEAPSARDMPEGTSAAGLSFIYDYTAAGTGGVPAAHDIVGDVGARPAFMTFNTTDTADRLGRLWMGFRSENKHPTITNFVPVWEIEDGTLGTDAALAADASASPGGGGNTKATITPGTATWVKRMTLNLDDVTANTEDHFGSYLWLLRSQVSGGDWEVQLRWGNDSMGDSFFVHGPIVEVSRPFWYIYEMGEQVIPLRNLHALPTSLVADTFDDGFEIQIWARRTSGAGTLDLDCLMLVPVDEGYLILQEFDMVFFATNRTYVGTSPEDEIYSVQQEAAQFGEIATVDGSGFYLPPGDGRLIIIYSRRDVSDIGDLLAVNLDDEGKYYERWLSLRGAE